MNTELLHIFIDVAEAGSFAGAAKHRNIDPSSVSRAIATLENHIDAQLFHRTTRNIALTEAGEIYLKRVKPICDELAHAQEELHSTQKQLRGRIRFSTSVAFGQACIVPLLSELRQQYPKLEIDLKLSDRNLDIINEQLDFAIRLNKNANRHFIRSRLKRSQYRVCAAPTYINKNRKISAPEDISSHQCIVFDLPNYRDKWTFISSQKKIQDIAIPGQIMLSSAIAIKDCTLQGMGISLLADWLVDKDIAAGNLINLFPDYQVSADNFDTAIWIVYPQRAFLPAKTRATIDFIKNKLAENAS